MRRRTPSEIKAYGDGYAEAYKEFCHLLEKNDKDKAIRKMELFAKAVEITVETATDEPQTEEPTPWCKYCQRRWENDCVGVAQCIRDMQMIAELYKASEDEPQTERSE